MSTPVWPPNFRCIECGCPDARCVDSREIYPRRPDLAGKPVYRCACGAYVGCHPDTRIPLGYPAGPETRRARRLLHNDRLDPLWKKARPGRRKKLRVAAYGYLAERMGIPREQVHTGMFTIEQCREAWRYLGETTTAELLGFSRRGDPQEEGQVIE